MKRILPVVALLGILGACSREEEDAQAEEKPTVATDLSSGKTLAQTIPRVEVVFSDSPTQLIPSEPPPMPPIVYAPGDTFQGMWNYDRRNFSLRLTITSVDTENRTVETTLMSVDLDDSEKKFRGTVGEDGRQLFLEGITGTGSDNDDEISGYHVRDLLGKSSTQKLKLTDCGARKIRGSTEDGTKVYFWTKVKPK